MIILISLLLFILLDNNGCLTIILIMENTFGNIVIANEGLRLIKFIGFDVSESQKRAARQAAETTAGYAGSRSVPRKSRELVASVNIRSARTAPRIRRQRIPTIRWVCTPFLINRLVHCFPLVNIAVKRDWMASGRKLIAETDERKTRKRLKTEKNEGLWKF